MKKLTQKQRVLNRIHEVGYVDNLWAVKNSILRLSAIMCDLKQNGIKFEAMYGAELKKPIKLRKNYYYLIK